MKDKTPTQNKTIIGPSLTVKGDLVGEGDLVIEGNVSGSIKTRHNLTIGKDAEIKASIEAGNAQIGGKVEGDITVEGKLELLNTAILNGNINCQQLYIESGAVFNGQCSMKEQPTDNQVLD